MREYRIVSTPGAPDWARVPELNIDTPLWGTGADIRAWAQLCWDGAALRVRLRARERDIRAEHPADAALGMPCEDSCLELFFSPMPGDARYFNFEFNPRGCMYLGFGRDRESRVRLIADCSAFDPRPAPADGGWEIAFRVPLEFIRGFFPDFAPRAGWEMRANCYKCGDRTPRAHYLSWNPCTSPAPDFHQPRDFGRMIFG